MFQRFSFKNGVTLSCLLALSLSGPVFSVEIPGSVQPGQIEKQLNVMPAPKAETPHVQTLPNQAIPEQEMGEISFQLNDINLKGATVYPPDELKSYFTGLIGKNVTLKQLKAVTANITAKYRNDGYVLAQVYIPKQTLKDGLLQLDVLEGSIADVKIQGDDLNDSFELINGYIEKIKEIKPLNIETLEHYILLINDLPGISANGSLTPSAAPGSADLILSISRKAFGGALGFNNRLTKLLGTYRGEVYGEVNNILGLQEKSTARVLQSFNNNMTVLSFGEDLPLLRDGTRISLMYNRVTSNTAPVDITTALNSELNSLNLVVTHPIFRSRNSNLSVRGTFSMVDSTSTNSYFNQVITNDRIRSLRAGLSYDLADRWRGVNITDVEISQGINGLGARDPSGAARDNGTAQLSAAQGQPDYVKANLYLARLQTITSNLSFLLAGQGQYTQDVLLAPEQFSLGGENFLRAYDPSEFIGDKGFATKAELRYTLVPYDPASTTFYTFYDYGEIHYNSPIPSISVAATGLGMRLTFGRHFSGYVEGAAPLHPVQSIQQSNDMRIFGGLKLTY